MNDIHHQSVLDIFNSLPRSNDEFFRQLWHGRKLRFEGSGGKPDEIDVYSSQLACATLSQKQSLLIVLPDHAVRRMPLIFITGLVMHSLDFMNNSHDHRVIYFGTSASIKDYLSQSFIRDQRMSDIFNQTYVGHTTSSQGKFSNNLPNVIFSYAPTSVEQIIASYNPKWVFIDCGEGEKIDWVSYLLQELAKRNIIGIACTSNPLSNILGLFEKADWDVFSWASTAARPFPTTEITPISIQSRVALEQAEKFQMANQILSSCIKQVNGRLQMDALRAVGRFVTGLENLSLPLHFFEAESKHFWGINSIQILRQTAERFIESIEIDPVGRKLRMAFVEADSIFSQFSKNKPPLWLALEQLCIDPPDPTSATVFVFQNRAYKQLFSLAMLAENNIAEHELLKLNIWLLSLKQFVQWQFQMERRLREGIDPIDIPPQLMDQYLRWHPILIGVPNKYNYAKYAYLLRHKKLDNLLLPHQMHLASWHYNQWINRFNQIPQKNLNVLKHLVPNGAKILSSEEVNVNRIQINIESDILIDDELESVRSRLSKLLEIATKTEELVQLMDEITIKSEDISVSDTSVESSLESGNGVESPYVEKVLVIRFKEKFEVLFDLADKVQTVVETPLGRDLQERSVRSLRLGDVIVFINGQQRQSLYDLIISRVHDHPTFSLHISLVMRWQEELATCFNKAKIPIANVLAQMQAKGSHIQTETAIRFWLLGYVMCPSDTKDLQRIAEILDMPFVKQYYSHIDKAARRLRGIHISLARKLNKWLEQEVFSHGTNSFNDLVDAELGLEFKDFREALMILTVESVSEENGLFLTTSLGVLSPIN